MPSPSGSLDKPRLGREVAENVPGASEPSSSSLSSFGENPTLVLCHVFTVVFIYRQYKCPSLKCARFIFLCVAPLLYCMHLFLCVDLCSGQAATGPRIIRQADQVCLVFEAASAHILSHFFPSCRVLHKVTTKSLLVLSRESPLRNLRQETLKHGSSTGKGGLSQIMSFGMGKVNFSTTLRGLVPAPQPGHQGLQISAQPGLGREVPYSFQGGQKTNLLSLAELHQASGPSPAFRGCWASFIGGSSSKSRLVLSGLAQPGLRACGLAAGSGS